LEVDKAIANFTIRTNDYYIGNSDRPKGRCGIFEPCGHLSFTRLLERYDIEKKVIAMGLLDDGDGGLNLLFREGIEGVRQTDVSGHDDSNSTVLGCLSDPRRVF